MNATLGEIRLVGFNYAPAGWALCNGQLLNISDYSALFNLLQTTYGGDGVSSFAVPNLSGRVVPGTGPGRGLSSYAPGQTGGAESVTLTANQLPAHTHALGAGITVNATTQGTGQNPPPAGAYPGPGTSDLYGPLTGTDALAAGAVTGSAQPAGGSQPHANLQPVLALNYIIALEGIYPSQP
ncbi:MAG: phage tail protein [Hymenobacter sp.]|nr:MAG: phage tail protein [Hymenobacter sp.]